jgi:hypothetical protein
MIFGGSLKAHLYLYPMTDAFGLSLVMYRVFTFVEERQAKPNLATNEGVRGAR